MALRRRGRTAKRSPLVMLDHLEKNGAGVRASNEADLARHLRVRAAFLNHFMADPNVRKLMQDLLVPSLDARLRSAIAELDQLARDRGFVDRGTMVCQDSDGRAVAQGLYDRAVPRLLVSRVSEIFAGYLLKLDLRWPWLALAMTEAFEIELSSFLGGYAPPLVGIGVRLEAPELTLVWSTGPHETPEEAERRLSDLYTQALEAINRRATAQGRAPKQADYLEQNAEWLYRHRVRHTSISKLAREAGKSRGAVQQGIGRAEELLSFATPA